MILDVTKYPITATSVPIKVAPIQTKDKLLESMAQREQQALEQKKLQIQQQNQLQKLTIAALESTVRMQDAQAMERQSKVVKNLPPRQY